jgi:glycosyltransferase involved in cell wall biosynthesis
MKTVLIIVHDFPPVGGGGVMRCLKFAKYLPSFGWKPIILTVDQKSTFNDQTLLDELPKNVEIIRTKSLSSVTLEQKVRKSLGESKELSKTKKNGSNLFKVLQKINLIFERLFFLPDRRILWKYIALREAKKVINTKRIDAIITSGPPHSTHLIGLSLRRQYSIPWIADFRDGWTSGPEWKSITLLHSHLDFTMEKNVIKHADAILTATNPIKTYLTDKYFNSEKVYTLTNGFDPEDFETTQEAHQYSNKCTIIHAGSLKRNRTGANLYKAITELKEENEINNNTFELLFYGRVVPSEMQLINLFKLSDLIKCVGFKTHKEMCKILRKADILLIITYTIEPHSNSVLTGKIFDYIAARRPVLAITPEGVAKDLVQGERIGFVADPNNVEEIKKQLLYFFNLWRKKNLPNLPDYKNSSLEKFSRKKLTSELSNHLNKIISKS